MCCANSRKERTTFEPENTRPQMPFLGLSRASSRSPGWLGLAEGMLLHNLEKSQFWLLNYLDQFAGWNHLWRSVTFYQIDTDISSNSIDSHVAKALCAITESMVGALWKNVRDLRIEVCSFPNDLYMLLKRATLMKADTMFFWNYIRQFTSEYRCSVWAR